MRGSRGPRQPGGGKRVRPDRGIGMFPVTLKCRREAMASKGDGPNALAVHPLRRVGARHRAARRPAPLAAHLRMTGDRAEAPAAPMPTGVQTVPVTPDEAGMRVDRFLEARFPGLSFSPSNASFAKANCASMASAPSRKTAWRRGRTVRIPPLRLDAPKQPRAPGNEADEKTRAFLKSITLYEDADVLVFNEPMEFAIQAAAQAPRAISMACWRCCATRTANGPGLFTGSTRTRPGASWSPRRALRRRLWPRPSARVRRARCLGPWWLAFPRCSRAVHQPFWPRKNARTNRSCGSPAMARRVQAMP